ncbi:hypothetical protein [Paucilactobacillus sp. N302-9]
MQEWSQIGQLQSKSGKKLFCGKCKFQLSGQRYCPNCGSKIIYDGEDQNGVPLKWALKDAEYKANGNTLSHIGDNLTKTGNTLTMGCLLPIIGVILILLILLIL